MPVSDRSDRKSFEALAACLARNLVQVLCTAELPMARKAHVEAPESGEKGNCQYGRSISVIMLTKSGSKRARPACTSVWRLAAFPILSADHTSRGIRSSIPTPCDVIRVSVSKVNFS